MSNSILTATGAERGAMLNTTAAIEQSSSEIAFSTLAASQRSLEDHIEVLAERLAPALHPEAPCKAVGSEPLSRPGLGVPLVDAIWLANDRAVTQRERLLSLINRLAI